MAAKQTDLQFKQSESVAAALRRLTAAQCSQARQSLKAPDPADAVHKIRLAFKFLRALLKLTRTAVGEQYARHENVRLRDASLALSPWRDAAVVRHTLDELGDAMPKGPHQVMQDALAQWQRQVLPKRLHQKTLKTVMREAVKNLRVFEQSLHRQALAQARWKKVAAGLRKSYRKAHRSIRLAKASGVDETFHEARKRTKDLFYHVSLVERAGSDRLTAVKKRLQKLQTLLGKDHDVAVAREVVLRMKPDAGKDHEKVLKALKNRSHALRQRIQRQSEKLFTSATNACVNEVGKHLRKWPET